MTKLPVPRRNRFGAKPSVAFLNHNQALANIEAKLEVLVKALVDKNFASDLPSSVRKFNAWTPRAELGTSLRKNARATLVESGFRTSVSEAIELLKGERALAASKPSKDESAAKLRLRIKESSVLRRISERVICKQRDTISSLTTALATAKGALVSTEKEALALNRLLQSQLDAVRTENAKLVESMRKISSLRAVSNDAL